MALPPPWRHHVVSNVVACLGQFRGKPVADDERSTPGSTRRRRTRGSCRERPSGPAPRAGPQRIRRSPRPAGAPVHHRDGRRRERLFITGTAAGGSACSSPGRPPPAPGTAPAAGCGPGRVPDAAALTLLHRRHARRSVRSGYRGRSGRYGTSGQPGLPGSSPEAGSSVKMGRARQNGRNRAPPPGTTLTVPGLPHIGPQRGDHSNSAHTCPGRRLVIEAIVDL